MGNADYINKAHFLRVVLFPRDLASKNQIYISAHNGSYRYQSLKLWKKRNIHV